MYVYRHIILEMTGRSPRWVGKTLVGREANRGIGVWVVGEWADVWARGGGL